MTAEGLVDAGNPLTVDIPVKTTVAQWIVGEKFLRTELLRLDLHRAYFNVKYRKSPSEPRLNTTTALKSGAML